MSIENDTAFHKQSVDAFALLGGQPAFSTPLGTSGLARPDVEAFLSYSKRFFDAKQYTNNGPLVRELEKRLAAFHDAEHCVTFCSGFWALVMAIETLKLANKSEIVMPSLTYRRLADVAAWTGLRPRFCDVDPKTLAISPETAREAITDETALIVGVHPIVNCCDAAGLIKLSEETGIPLLIDAVESVYEETEHGRVGSMAPIEVFSLHASKLINGAEGGYITTSNSDLRDKLRLIRGFGFQGQDNVVVGGGTNAKLNEIHAALALANLDSLEQFVAHNQNIYRTYEKELEVLPGMKLLAFDERFKTSYKNIVVELTEDWPLSRDRTIEFLNSENVLARPYYSPALHQKPMRYPHFPASLKTTEKLCSKFILMPSGFMVNPNQIRNLISLLRSLFDAADQISEYQERAHQ